MKWTPWSQLRSYRSYTPCSPRCFLIRKFLLRRTTSRQSDVAKKALNYDGLTVEITAIERAEENDEKASFGNIFQCFSRAPALYSRAGILL
jgi:hypothetical protein